MSGGSDEANRRDRAGAESGGANIDAVIAELGDIVAQCRSKNDRIGYFAALYLEVTKQIKVAISDDVFQNAARMERLDVVFAHRFIDAYRQHERLEEPSRSWAVSFAGTTKWRPIVVQQLLTGMNAHINLDLGIAAATVAPGDLIDDLHTDFDRINDVLSSMTGRFIDDVGQVSPWLGVLDRIGGRSEQHVIKFSIDIARDEAWSFAKELAGQDQARWASAIAARDDVAASLGKLVLHPGLLMSAGLFIIRIRETNDVVRVIDLLGSR